MKKIIVIGLSGAGKTTLAKKLSHILSIPHTELDSINHQANWTAIDSKEFRKRVNNLTKQGGWVFCGNYFNDLGIDFWKKADTIIWCDYPFPIIFGRLIRRTLRRTLTHEELWNGNKEGFIMNFFTRDSVILWMLKSRKKQKTRYGKIFSNPIDLPGTRLIHLQTKKQMEKLLKEATTY